MAKFPADAPLRKVISTLEQLGFQLVREGNHIAMLRKNPDGSQTPLTIPNHPSLKKSTLRTILTQSKISRDEFLKIYYSWYAGWRGDRTRQLGDKRDVSPPKWIASNTGSPRIVTICRQSRSRLPTGFVGTSKLFCLVEKAFEGILFNRQKWAWVDGANSGRSDHQFVAGDLLSSPILRAGFYPTSSPTAHNHPKWTTGWILCKTAWFKIQRTTITRSLRKTLTGNYWL